jgi:hypothetical protein
MKRLNILILIVAVILSNYMFTSCGIMLHIAAGLADEDSIVEIKDSRNRLIVKKIIGDDCCEGHYEFIYHYDTLGNLILEDLLQDGTRTKTAYVFNSNGKLLSRRHFEFVSYSDTLPVDSLIQINGLLESESNFEYYPNDSLKMINHVLYYLSDWDTLSKETLSLNELGDTIGQNKRIFRRNNWNDVGAYDLMKINQDKLLNKSDTIL